MKLVVHVGAGKCGSSAVQSYLAANADALRRSGVLVPGTALDFQSASRGQQVFFFQSLLRDPDTSFAQSQTAAPGAGDFLKGKILALKENMQREGLDTLVLSAENLGNEPVFAELLAFCRDEFDCRIILYVRRQDDFLISAWAQWYLKLYDSFLAYVGDRLLIDGNWARMAAPWRQVFGTENICVRVYARDRLVGGDVAQDFAQAAGLPGEGCVFQQQAANPSVNDTVAELANRIRDVFPTIHDAEFYDVMTYLTGEHALKRGSRSSVATLEERLAIYAAYAPSNAELQSLYFPAGGGPLFAPPTADDVLSLSAEERLRNQIALLTRAVYATGRKLRAHGL